MTTAKRKTRKLRGSRCHGWGRSGQHRDSGMLGGHGNAGWKRHKWSAVIRYNLEMGSGGFHPAREKTTNASNDGAGSVEHRRVRGRDSEMDKVDSRMGHGVEEVANAHKEERQGR